MENQTGISKVNKRNFLLRGTARSILRVVILVAVLLVLNLGIVKAQEFASSTAAVDAPVCGTQPFCRDILAGNTRVVAFECRDQPICSYLEGHNSAAVSAATSSWSAVLMSQPLPGAYDIQLEVIRPTMVHSGPGEKFYSYGELPAAFFSRVIGVGRLGNWWVIPLPLTTALDGMGWVDGASVSVSNVSTAQIDPPACQGFMDCGIIQAHSQPYKQFGGIDCSKQPICSILQAHNRQKLAVLRPSYAIEKFLGLPVIIGTGE